jgi:type III secretion protein J
MRPVLRSVVRAAALVAVGCSVPVAGNLDETDANQAVVVLERGGVGAAKERDPEHENRFQVSVPSGEASQAIGLLARENLPPRSSPGVLEALGGGSVVPSRLAEHAKWTAGIAGDLERSLLGVDGVLSARVHLAVPPKEPLEPELAVTRPSASVLVRHRGASAPVPAAEVQRLVAGAVAGLAPDQVTVVLTSSPGARASEAELARFGPITVTRGSQGAVRAIVVAAVVLNLVLVAGVLFLWARLRRAELALVEVKTERDDARPDRR